MFGKVWAFCVLLHLFHFCSGLKNVRSHSRIESFVSDHNNIEDNELCKMQFESYAMSLKTKEKWATDSKKKEKILQNHREK